MWLNAVALFGLAAIAAPILVHLLVQRRAERFPFPTLRFLEPTRLASMRRHLLDDMALLAVRVAALALAAAALGGPLIVTSSRRDAWSRRIVRATVLDAAIASSSPNVSGAGQTLYHTREFRGTSLRDGVRRAVAWLEHAPPARRELLIVSPLPIGAITAADLVRVPPDVGIAFERSGTLPVARSVPFGRVRTGASVVSRVLMFEGDRTSVRETASESVEVPIEIVAPPEAKPIVAAALDAVLAQRVWMPPPERRIRVRFGGADVEAAESVRRPWMADAVARLTRDADLQNARSRSTATDRDVAWMHAPWRVVALAADGRPLVAAAAGVSEDTLVIASAAPAADVVTPILLRAVVNAVAPAPVAADAEIVPIADAQLQAWSRPAVVSPQPRIDAIDDDDRRWFWIAVLFLLGVEGWMRRARRDDAAGRHDAAEAERVA